MRGTTSTICHPERSEGPGWQGGDARAVHAPRSLATLGMTAILFLLCEAALAQELPKTTAESSNYRSTSRYDDVIAFVSAIQRAIPTFASRRLRRRKKDAHCRW